MDLQRAENIGCRPGYGTGRVEVVDAYQPFALVMPGIQIAADGGDQGTGMERAGGGGGEAPPVLAAAGRSVRQ